MENDGVCWGRLAPSGAAGHSNRLVFTPFSSGCAPRSRSSLEPTCVIKSNAISQKLCQSAACGGGGAAERGGNNSLSRYGFVRNRQPAATPGEGLKECPRGVLSLPFAGCGYCRVLQLICTYLTLRRQRGICFVFSAAACEVQGTFCSVRVPLGRRADLYLSTKCDFVRSRAGRSRPMRRPALWRACPAGFDLLWYRHDGAVRLECRAVSRRAAGGETRKYAEHMTAVLRIRAAPG